LKIVVAQRLPNVINFIARSVTRMLFRNRISVFAVFLALAAILLQGCASREEKIANTLKKAESLISEQKVNEAIEKLREGTTKFEESAPLFETLGNTLIKASKMSEGVEAFKSAIALDPSRAQLWVRIGDIERSLSNYPAAIEAYQKYLTEFPSDFLAWKSLTKIHQEKGDRAAAIEAAFAWNRSRPSAEPARILGSLFSEGGNVSQARSWYSQSAAYGNGEASRDSLATIIEMEIGLQQFLPAETWLKRYEEQYPNTGSDARVLKAKDVLQKWREAQREIAELAQQSENQEQDLEEKREAALESERLIREERERKLAAQLAEQESEAAEEVETDNTEELPPPNTPIKAPTPLADSAGTFNTPVPAPVPTSNATEQAIAVVATNDPAAAIDAYWNALGENPDNAANWHALASLYTEQQSYSDAEACILEARRRNPLSIEINALYLTIISNTAPTRQLFEEATAVRAQFPREPLILLNFAKAIQNANAAPNQVRNAYQAFLEIASPTTQGYQEAQSFLNSGN